MARKATSKAAGGGARKKTKKPSSQSTAVAKTASRGSGRSSSQDGMGASDAFIKLLQSPLVADLVAVAATAALAALAEHGFSSRGSGGADQRRAGRAVKEAGKAAAAAIGRRLSTEIQEIRKASKGAKAGAEA